MSTRPLVSIVMGSDSDLEIMREAGKVLDEFGIDYEIDVTSAHRSPDRTADYARKAAGRGIRVIIAGAGGAAHLDRRADSVNAATRYGFAPCHGADAGRNSRSRRRNRQARSYKCGDSSRTGSGAFRSCCR